MNSTAETFPAVTGKRVREHVLRESRRANVGHIGSALSIADIVAALYGGILRIASPDDPDRDRFILSKGHAALALYAALALRGWISEEQLATYCGDDSLLGVHPEHALNGVDFSIGSLGHGLPIAAGCALAASLSGSARRVFVIVSDAELNEGSTWEALMFAAQHRFSNLYVFVDSNGQQALGYTRDVIAIDNAAARFDAFGWDAQTVDGHDVAAMRAAVDGAAADPRPHVFVARTVFGQGVSFMKNRIKWHYWPMSADEFAQAMTEVAAT
ncbi:MAG: transketolase, beta subunit [Candidatus Eremiobacteraeota bacterium]|nr:transketolase, beta subunit [Candidatus Eremiobacteraeota bacterium]